MPKSHSSVERAALIGGVMMKKVPTDNSYAVRGENLQKMIDEDKAAGLIPFYVRQNNKTKENICPSLTQPGRTYRGTFTNH